LTIETRWLRVERAEAGDAAIQEAARLLRGGKIVAFPTETVYGLGAAVGNERAVRAIFAAKGRPAAVPLIVHVCGIEQARRYVTTMPESAVGMMRGHWPGPLTVVLDRCGRVPDAVTAGGGTVGVRAPDHPVALALIEVLGEGIAAPSANLYERLPSVRAEHVMSGMAGRIDAVLDGGRCPGGLESTVVDARETPAVVLRRGAVDPVVLGVPVREEVAVASWKQGGWIRVGDASDFEGWVGSLGGAKVGRLGRGAGVGVRGMPADARSYAREMYDALHELWGEGCARVWVDAPPREAEWEPIWDRLARLSGLSPP
jgi:L-threonylcarbamoyladenylate synthase